MEKPLNIDLAPSPVGVALDRLPLTSLHVVVLALCSFGMFCDALELAMSHTLATVFSTGGSQVAPRDLSLILSAAFVGAAFGAPLMGRVADRWGRRLALLLALLGFGATSIGAGLVPSIRALGVMRLLNGFFLGAYLPVMTIYLAELLPPRSRGRWTLVVATLGGLGGTFGPLLTRWFDQYRFAGLEGWRWALIAGGVGGLFAALFVLLLPESPRWLALAGRSADAERQLQRFRRAARGRAPASVAPVQLPVASAVVAADPVRLSVWSRPYRGRVLVYFFLQVVVPWVQIGFMMLTGMTFARRGLPLQESLFYVGIATAGPPVGGLLGAWIADRFERPQLLAVCAFGAAALALLFMLAPVPLIGAGAAFGYNMLIAIFTTIVMLLGAELLPTAVRGTMATAGYACNRIAAMLLPISLIPFFHVVGEQPPLLLLAMLLAAVAIVAIRFVPRGTANRSLS